MLLIGSVGSGFSLILTVLHWPVMQHRDVDHRHQGVALAKGLSRLNHSSARHRTPSFHMEVMFFILSLSRGRKNINFLRIRQQLLSTWPETNKAAVTSGFTCCFSVNFSPAKSRWFHGSQAAAATASDSPGYLWTRFNSSWDVEPPASGGASQWEDFLSGEKQIILTQSSHFASLFLRRLWS